MGRLPLLCAVVLLTGQSVLRAQSASTALLPPSGVGLTIDLAAQTPGIDLQRPLAIDRSTPVSLELVNVLPEARYLVSVAVDDVPIGALALSKGPALALPTTSAVHLLYSRLVAELDTAGDETAVRRTTTQTRRDVEHAYGDEGDFMLDSIGARTVHRLASVASIAPGQRLRVTVVRHSAEGKEVARWTTTYSTGPTGEWQVALGFAFPIVLGSLEHYALRRDSAGVARVGARPSDDRIDAVPALLFNWVPRDDRLSALSWSLGGGIGFDFDFANPVVLVGGSLSYRQNITLTLGAAAHGVPRLAAEYAVGDEVGSHVAVEELMTRRYRIDPFVAVSFRLLGASFAR